MQKHGAILTSTSAESARGLLAALDKIIDKPPQYLTAQEVERLFEHAQKIRLQLSRLKK
jgi:hypothetical protein